MNKPLPPYPDYKPAGLPWLAEVPAHWEQVSIRAITAVRNTRNRPDLQLLSVYREYGVIPKSSRDDNHNADGSDLAAYKVVEPGYLVLNKMKTWQGSLGISSHHGIVSPAYIVCAVTRTDIDKRYLNMLLRSRPYVAIYNSISFGVRVGQWDMRYDDFKQIKVLLPPLPEQQRIVAFLDGKTRQIARLLRNKRQLIKLLTEQKQNVVQNAVLHGLNNNIELKASGVEWFTEVPAHWTVTKLKHLATVRSGIAKGKVYLNGEELIQVPYLRVANVQDGYLNLNDVTTIQVTKREADNYKLEPFDLLMNEGGDIDKLGRGTVWHGELDNCINQNHVFALRPKRNTNVYFLNYFVGAPACKKYFQLKGKQTTNLASISASAIAATPIALPPVEEQIEIVEFIKRETQIIDQTIARAHREIELIQEYRTRLIADVVTGRVDIRHLADAASGMELPDEDELELEDEENSENEEETVLETEDGRD